jgi:hypothetical protein
MGSSTDKMIINILLPYFGQTIAEGALQLSCKSLGVDRTDIDSSKLPAIAKAIEKRLVVFLGTEKAAVVAGQIAALKV